MPKIYKRTDKIKLKIDEVIVTISPLSLSQKSEVQVLMNAGVTNRDIKSMQEGVVLILKYGLKDIEGLTDSDGRPYKLEFENDILKDECIEDLFNIELHHKLVNVCSSLLKGISNKITDSLGNPIEGVEFVSTKSEVKSDPN